MRSMKERQAEGEGKEKDRLKGGKGAGNIEREICYVGRRGK